jgi:Flp pilus assembly protein TadB
LAFWLASLGQDSATTKAMEVLLVMMLFAVPVVPFLMMNAKKRKRLEKIHLTGGGLEDLAAFQSWRDEKMKALKWGMWGWIGLMLWTIPIFLVLAVVGWSYASAGHKRAKRLAKALPEPLRTELPRIA